MPNCDFYGTTADHAQLLSWLFEERSCEVHELASAFEQPLRRFSSPAEVLALFEERYTTGEKVKMVYLQLYVLGAGPPFVPRRVPLDPKKCGGATFRYSADGWGLVQLYLGTVWAGELQGSHTNHNSQKRATAWAPLYPEDAHVGQWDFPKITALSSRLNRQIKKMSVGKLGSRPVLPGALALWDSGINFPPFRHASDILQRGDA